MKQYTILFLAAVLSVIAFSGCGYISKSLAHAKSTKIFIKPFENKVDMNITGGYSDMNPYRLYRPGMETKVTDAVINRFLLDGSLKVVSKKEDAELILTGALKNYDKQPLKYNEFTKKVEEYRANIIVDMELADVDNDKVLWKETDFVGYYEFNLIGSNSETEDTAINHAVEDLARRVVERTVEDW